MRSDGTFPSFNKIDVDPHIWPEKYWDSSRVCPNCGTNWPAIGYFAISPCCDQTTALTFNQSPDMRWPEAVFELLSWRFEKFYSEYNEGVTDEALRWDDDAVQASVDQFLDTLEGSAPQAN